MYVIICIYCLLLYSQIEDPADNDGIYNVKSIGPALNRALDYAGVFYDNEISQNIADCSKMMLCNAFGLPLAAFSTIPLSKVPFVAKLMTSGKLITSISMYMFKKCG